MKVGNDVIINADHVMTRPDQVVIGNHVAIDKGFYCTTGLTVGDYVHISPYVTVIGGRHTALHIEDFCFVSVGAKMICGSELFQGHGLIGPLIPNEYQDRQILEPIVLRRFSGVCANSVVMSGVIMAEGSILGANSFLKSNTEPWTIYAGNPARPIKKRQSETMIKYAKLLGYSYE